MKTTTAARGDSPWLNPREAAQYLGVSVESIYEACARKGLKHAKLGHSTVRLRREWCDAWAEQHSRTKLGEQGEA